MNRENGRSAVSEIMPSSPFLQTVLIICVSRVTSTGPPRVTFTPWALMNHKSRRSHVCMRAYNGGARVVSTVFKGCVRAELGPHGRRMRRIGRCWGGL